MKIFLVLSPVIVLLFGIFIYRFNGRRELMRMDLVQFIYTFVVAPSLLIWIKSVVFLNLNSTVGIVDPEDKFIIDTILTTISFFIYAFLVMHSLTKTFAIKKKKDPLFDIFEHTEYFHKSLTHLATYSGMILIFFLLGCLNVFSPLLVPDKPTDLYVGIFAGLLLGLIFYIINRISKDENHARFSRIMNLEIYFYTFALIVVYTVFRPRYSSQYAMYWSTTSFFMFSTVSSQIMKRYGKRSISKSSWGLKK